MKPNAKGVEFDSQQAPSNTTSVYQELSRFGLRNMASGICSPRTKLFGFSVSARSSYGLGLLRICVSSRIVVLPLKLDNAEGVSPRPDANCLSLSMPSAFVKISTTWRFVLTCCRSILPGLNALADEVVVHFDMFSSGVKHGVAREVYATHIVAEDTNRIRNGNAQVL